MMYIIVLATALTAVMIATPLAILTVKWLDRRSSPPPATPAPAPESLSDLERIERIARGGRRIPRT